MLIVYCNYYFGNKDLFIYISLFVKNVIDNSIGFQIIFFNQIICYLIAMKSSYIEKVFIKLIVKCTQSIETKFFRHNKVDNY